MTLSVGDEAPGFEVNIDGDGKFSLEGAKGSNVILYFYPKDDTPGCTKEACGFRAAFPDFSALNATIVGVSKDTVAKHDKFKSKYDEIQTSFYGWLIKNSEIYHTEIDYVHFSL